MLKIEDKVVIRYHEFRKDLFFIKFSFRILNFDSTCNVFLFVYYFIFFYFLLITDVLNVHPNAEKN